MIKTGRLHLRLSSDLEKRIKEYAKRHHTTITRMVEEHFLFLLQDEALADVEPGKQI